MTLYDPFRSLLCRSCYYNSVFQARRFHTRPRLRSGDAFPNHYDTLGLSPSATPGDIKKQFYALSKKHHPDLNPDKSSAQKFVQISEAYHVLGSPTKRTTYDRDYQRIHSPPLKHHHGSYSSHQTSPAGGRPASGLSRRRTQFRGPPPSFYRSGGYGGTSGKRERAAYEAHSRTSGDAPPGGLGSKPHEHQQDAHDPSSPFFNEHNEEIPYWDRDAHHRTHETLRQRRERQANENRTSSMDEVNLGGSLLWNFFLVSGIMAIATGVPAWWNARAKKKVTSKRANASGEG